MFRRIIANQSWKWIVSAALLWLAAPIAAAEENEAIVQVPAAQLTQIQSELLYLRQREAQRSSRENTLLTLASFRKSQCDVGCDPIPSCDVECGDCGVCDSCSECSSCDACDACQMAGCELLGGLCGCLCHGCPKPICPAPCVDCPRVTTLNPYFNVRLFGALKLDMMFSEPRPFATGVPFYLTPESSFGFDQNSVSFHARQSTIGAALTGPQFNGFQSGGQLMAVLFNDSVIQDQYGLLPLQGYGELKNDRWRFAAGLQFDVFAPGAPTVLPFSILGASGNAGNSFRGQLRAERFFVLSRDVQWTAQMALSDPITSTIDSAFRLLEDNGWPNVEGRIALGLGQKCGPLGLRPFELGVSGVVGQIRFTDIPSATRVVTDVWGGAVDWRWAITPGFGFLGEAYTGNGLGTYNGGILQTINAFTFEGVHSSGGFFETYVYLTPRLHTHVGYGIDNPRDSDLPTDALAFARGRNETYFANLLWDVNQTFRIGFECTYRDTDYVSPQLLDNQGPGFHTQLQWLF